MVEISSKEKFLLQNHPRPNRVELPALYEELDRITMQIQRNLMESKIYDTKTMTLDFSKMDEDDFHTFIKQDPKSLVPFFTCICGLSIREFNRLYRVKNVYSLRKSSKWPSGRDEKKFVKAIKELLPNEMHIETALYTFYKGWEEHQKRHYRGRKFEEQVRKFFRNNDYECGKITDPVEVDAAIPPTKDPKVLMPIRTGVLRNFDKRAKEYRSEYDEMTEAFPKARFVVVFKIPSHELKNRDIVRKKLEETHAPSEGQFDEIVFQDELKDFLSKLEEWKVPKKEFD